MSDYKLTVGLEIHAELSTKTKMFCDSKNDPDEKRPNVNICPVCLGYPGTLPTINKEAVRSVLHLGHAVGGNTADYTEFDRKNYFYPDIPKGYQISQYKYPLVSGGSILDIPLTRIHLEEDTAKSSHQGDDYSLLDFNRAGVPLMELVTEPEIHDGETAAKFAKELQLILWDLGISEANMEKGEMRVEANISVIKNSKSEIRNPKLGTKVEIKNLNSFKSVEKAIRFEMNRQVDLLEKGESVIQETRGWDEAKEITFPQRVKEESHDYRYFPDPDLPKLFISEIKEFNGESLKATIPELPEQKRERYKIDYKIKDEDIEMYVRDQRWGSYFERVADLLPKEAVPTASNYITSDLVSLCKSDDQSPEEKISPNNFSKLIKLIASGTLSSRGGKDVLRIMFDEGEEPEEIAKEKNLIQKSDTQELKKIAEEIIASNPDAVLEYKNGKESSLQFLIGQGMKMTGGNANPQVLKNIFEELLR